MIDEYYGDNDIKQLNKELENKQNYHVLDDDKSEDYKIHEMIENIINYHKNGKVGIVNDLEGGLAIDYIDIDTNKECRFILGFTELGYWCYCNTYKENLK